MMKVRRANERGHAQHGWLESFHTFSFADYHDPDHMGFGPLRVINEDRVQPGMGFGTHAHRDMEIITYVLGGPARAQGQHRHRARSSRRATCRAMSAGRGVRHSEYNPSPSRKARTSCRSGSSPT